MGRGAGGPSPGRAELSVGALGFAALPRLAVAGHTLLPLPGDVFGLACVFQANGRFAWLPHYVVLYGVVPGLAARFRGRTPLVFAAMVALQALVHDAWRLPLDPPDRALTSPVWALACRRFAHDDCRAEVSACADGAARWRTAPDAGAVFRAALGS